MAGSPKKRARREAETENKKARVAARARAKSVTTASLLAELLDDIDLLPRDPKWIGQRINGYKVALGYRQQIHREAMAAQGIHEVARIITGPQSPPPGATDPPELP